MPFTSYATAADIEAYVPHAIRELWGGRAEDAEDSLRRAAAKINERLAGMDKFDVIPVEVDPDTSAYAEVLIELNVYEAIMMRVIGLHAGEAFEDNWSPFATRRNTIWTGIEEGVYAFGTEPDTASSGAKMIYLGRVSI